MRAGWEGNARLQEFVRRIDSTAELIAEVVAVEGYDTKHTQAEWAAGSAAGGSVDPLDTGGLRLAAVGATLASHGPDDGTQVTSLGAHPPFDALVVEHLGSSPEDVEFDVFTALLDPRADGGQPKTVDHFICEAFQIVKRVGADEIHVALVARSPKVDATGETADDFTFALRYQSGHYPVAGPSPQGDETSHRPKTLFRIVPYQADGSIADNVAWLADSAQGSQKTDSSTYLVTHYSIIAATAQGQTSEGGSVWELGGVVDNMPDFTLAQTTYPDTVTVTFSGAEAISVGAAAVDDLGRPLPPVVAVGGWR